MKSNNNPSSLIAWSGEGEGIAYTSAVLVAAFGWGVWSGEDLTVSLGISLAGLIGALGLVVVSTLISRNALIRASLVVGVIVAISAGVVLGSGNATSAFNECVSQGEAVRRKLAGHKDQKGYYPDNLSELGTELPGKRLLRGNILDYQKTARGYDILFRDRLVTHVANESSAFSPQK